jgi:hypothetical protein
MTELNPGEGRASRIEGIALVTVATIVWGSGGLFTRLLPFDLWTIVFWRGVFATLFIGAYVFYRFGRSTLKVVLDAGFEGVLVALCSTATIVLFPAAFQHTSVAKNSVCTPLWSWWRSKVIKELIGETARIRECEEMATR